MVVFNMQLHKGFLHLVNLQINKMAFGILHSFNSFASKVNYGVSELVLAFQCVISCSVTIQIKNSLEELSLSISKNEILWNLPYSTSSRVVRKF